MDKRDSIPSKVSTNFLIIFMEVFGHNTVDAHNDFTTTPTTLPLVTYVELIGSPFLVFRPTWTIGICTPPSYRLIALSVRLTFLDRLTILLGPIK